jgi:hypothetical protein
VQRLHIAAIRVHPASNDSDSISACCASKLCSTSRDAIADAAIYRDSVPRVMRMQKCEQPRCRRVFIYRAPRRRETTDRGCSRTLMERRIGRSCGIFRGIPGIFIKASMQRSGNHVRAGAPFSCACDSGRATRRARGYAGFRTPLNARRRCQRQSCHRRLHEQSARPTTVAQAPQRECWQWTLCCGEVFQSRPPGRATPVATSLVSRAAPRPIGSCSPLSF